MWKRSEWDGDRGEETETDKDRNRDIDKTYVFSSCTCDSNKSMVTKTHVCGEILKKNQNIFSICSKLIKQTDVQFYYSKRQMLSSKHLSY